MQMTEYELYVATISILIAATAWIILWGYISKGKKKDDMSPVEASPSSAGIGMWYAEHITDMKRSIGFSVFHFVTLPLVSFSIMLLFAPVYFQQLVPSVLGIVGLFALFGVGSGFDRRYSKKEGSS